MLAFQSRKKRLRCLLRDRIARSSKPRKIHLKVPRSTRFCSMQASGVAFMWNLEDIKSAVAPGVQRIKDCPTSKNNSVMIVLWGRLRLEMHVAR